MSMDHAEARSKIGQLEYDVLVLASERELISCIMIDRDPKAAARLDQINAEVTRLVTEAGKLKLALRREIKRDQPWRYRR